MLYNRPPTYEHIKVFGCFYYVRNASQNRDKFYPRAEQCVFVGYPIGQKGWKVYNLRTKEFLVSRDVTFYEENFPFITNINPGDINKNTPNNIDSSQHMSHFLDKTESHSEKDQEDLRINSSGQITNEQGTAIENTDSNAHSEGKNADLPQLNFPIGPRTRQPPAYLKDYYCHSVNENPTSKSLDPEPKPHIVYPISDYLNYEQFSGKHLAYLAAIAYQEETKSFTQAIKKKEWRGAMDQDIKALEENKT